MVETSINGYDVGIGISTNEGTRIVTAHYTVTNTRDMERSVNVALRVDGLTDFHQKQVNASSHDNPTRGGTLEIADINDGAYTAEFVVNGDVAHSVNFEFGAVQDEPPETEGHNIVIDSLGFANNPTSSLNVVDMAVTARNTTQEAVTETFDLLVNNSVMGTVSFSLGASNTGSGSTSKIFDAPVPGDSETMTVELGSASVTKDIQQLGDGSGDSGGSDGGSLDVPDLQLSNLNVNQVNGGDGWARYDVTSHLENRGGSNAKAWWFVAKLNGDVIEDEAIAVFSQDTNLPDTGTDILYTQNPDDDSHFTSYPANLELVVGYVETGSDATGNELLTHPDSIVTDTTSVTVTSETGKSDPSETPQANLQVSQIYSPHYQHNKIPQNDNVTILIETINVGTAEGTKWFNVKLNGSQETEFRAFEVNPGDTWTGSLIVNTSGRDSFTVSSGGESTTFSVQSDGDNGGSDGGTGGNGNGGSGGNGGNDGGSDGDTGTSTPDFIFWLIVAAVLVGIGVVALIIGT